MDALAWIVACMTLVAIIVLHSRHWVRVAAAVLLCLYVVLYLANRGG